MPQRVTPAYGIKVQLQTRTFARRRRPARAASLPAVTRTRVISDPATGAAVCERCVVADRPLLRMRGLLGRRDLHADEGLLLRPASSIHTHFMRFPIDVVFLDRECRVVDVRSAVRPWRMARKRGAKAVLELRAGEARRRGVEVGAVLRLADVAEARDA